ncbi:AMP-binding protein [Achromobacter sp. GG226]|uniref:(2,3-dihydroxybenzoyl)adenylate synthase n=1 Tax=Verticiella alkaliphila TaxID=2779529 RepID=UPI001C0D438A|nr:AMP-binding protein [Verticiella sp. GG226]MBU4612317.1 AMP-binding protein [Verticiella sp. GG226]
MDRPEQSWPAADAERYRAAGYWRGETFGQVLRERARQYGDKIAIVGGDQRWSYAELDRRADAMARAFLDSGLRPGDRVIVHLPNIPEFFSVIFGLFRAGILPLYALPAHRITEIEHFAVTGGARAYVSAQSHDGFDYRTLATELKARVPGVEQVLIVGDAGADTGFTALADFQARGEASTTVPVEPASSDVAFLQISGGSTGLSKLIPRTHDAYIYTLRDSDRICGMTEDSVFLGALPIAHNFPMSSPGVLGALYVGARVVLSTSPSPEAGFALVERESVTMTSLVPPLLLVWMEAAAKTHFKLDTLSVIQVGGAKLIPEVARRVKPALGVTLQQVFGMAEGLVNYTRLDDPDDIIIHTQGRPISPDDEVLIVDDLGNPVPEGETGHLLTRGPYTIRGYYNNEAANQRSFTEDGYYRTGDIVKRLPGGYLVVQGRANDHINRAGEKISAEEIEDHLLAHPQVFDAAVVSVPDEYLGERSCAFIIPKGDKPRAVAIKQWIRSRGLADFKVPDQVVFVERFSETAAGKISRKELRATLRAQLDGTKDSA